MIIKEELKHMKRKIIFRTSPLLFVILKQLRFDSVRCIHVLFIVNNESCYLIDGLPAEIRYLINISAGVSVVDIIQNRKNK